MNILESNEATIKPLVEVITVSGTTHKINSVTITQTL